MVTGAVNELEKQVKTNGAGELTKRDKWGKISQDNVIIYIAEATWMDGGMGPWKG